MNQWFVSWVVYSSAFGSMVVRDFGSMIFEFDDVMGPKMVHEEVSERLNSSYDGMPIHITSFNKVSK